MREKYTQNFKEMEKTKEFTETTYSGMKYAAESTNLVRENPFWAEAAAFYAKDNKKLDFLSDKFMYLSTKVDFILASCFIPNNKATVYQMKTHGESVIIEAKSPFNVFVREIKCLPYEKKFGVLINQRFYNPDDRYLYDDDGT